MDIYPMGLFNEKAPVPAISDKEEWELLGYLCSHTLRDPVRMIMKNCEPGAQKNGQASHLNESEIYEYAAQLEYKLGIMVDYIRMDSMPSRPKQVDCAVLVQGALEELADKPWLKSAQVEYEELPIVMGQKRRLAKLFSYLIDNACKFNQQSVPQVTISAEKGGDQWWFSVKDNGIGLPDADPDILFMLMQRPPESESYEGLGVGLALARKIVNMHGGHIWLEPNAEGGSVARFTLPITSDSGEAESRLLV